MTKGIWVGVGLLVLAIIIIGIGTILRSNKGAEQPSAAAPATERAAAPATMPTAPAAGGSEGEATAGATAPTGASDAGVQAQVNTSVSIPPSPIVKTTVSYSGNAFSPTSMTIKVGTTVTFENESTNAVWPASDPHPSHTNLLGFDAGAAIPSGGSYSYTFTKTGSWGYHNHLRSSEHGTVIVTN